jgi:hypothetical protein
MWCQRLPAVVLGVEDPEGFVNVVSHDPGQFALLSNELGESTSPIYGQSVDTAAKRRPHTTDWILGVNAQPEVVWGLRKDQDHPQREQPLLAIDHVEAVTSVVENDGAQDVRNVAPGVVVQGILDVVEQLEGRRRFPAVGALVVRNVQILAEQFADCDSTNAAIPNGHAKPPRCDPTPTL